METEGKFSPEEQGQYKEVKELTFDLVKKGSEILVYVSIKPEEIKEQPDYRIKVVGIRKDGLRVEVIPAFKGMGGDFTATMEGSFRGYQFDDPEKKPDYTAGVTPGKIEVTTPEVVSYLHFRSLKYPEGGKMSTSMNTTKIRKILFKQ